MCVCVFADIFNGFVERNICEERFCVALRIFFFEVIFLDAVRTRLS